MEIKDFSLTIGEDESHIVSGFIPDREEGVLCFYPIDKSLAESLASKVHSVKSVIWRTDHVSSKAELVTDYWVVSGAKPREDFASDGLGLIVRRAS